MRGACGARGGGKAAEAAELYGEKEVAGKKAQEKAVNAFCIFKWDGASRCPAMKLHPKVRKRKRRLKLHFT